MSSSDSDKAKDLVRGATDFAGAAIGGALGFLAGGPAAAAGAGALGVLVTRSLALVADKVMTVRERERVGTAATIALARIHERLKKGDSPRADFLASSGKLQPEGAQLLEGVLTKARDEYEERKLYYLGRFYGNLVFSGISLAAASFLIKTLERLTYRQLVFLSTIHRLGSINVRNLRSQNHEDPELEALKREEMDLHATALGSYGLVRGVGPFDDAVSPLGAVVIELANLDEIPSQDTESIIDLLAKCPEKGD